MFINIRSLRGAALLSAVPLLLCTGVIAFGQSPDLKIEGTLLTALTQDAAARSSFFVHFKDRADLTAASRAAGWADRGTQVVQRLQATAAGSQTGAINYLNSRGIAFRPYWVTNTIYVPNGTLATARALAAMPEVAAIQAERIYTIPPSPVQSGSSIQATQWNISKIRADQVWPYATGTGIVVANIDTGVLASHPILSGNYRGLFYDPKVPPTCPSATTPCDNDGHGTHTMGTMAGINGYGVAPGAQWIACKGCATNNCAGADLIACAQWILAPGGNTANRPHIVNNSWGGGHGDTWYMQYVDAWVAAGIFPAFSIGNSGPACATAGSPGEYDISFASGSTDSSDVIAGSSSRGPSYLNHVKPNVSAPGVNVLSSYNNGGYMTMSGTSMASPHTAGTVALIWQRDPAWKGHVIATGKRLMDTVVRLTTAETCGGLSPGVTPNNTYGYGRIDALEASKPGAPPAPPPQVLIATPTPGAMFACRSNINFTGTATDQRDGDITHKIQWTENNVQIGTGGSASKAYTCSELGSHTVTAKAINSEYLWDAKTVTFTIYDANTPEAPILSATASGRTVTARWNDVANETLYDLQRKLRGQANWTTVNSNIPANTTSYPNTAPSMGSYQYRIRACNGVSNCSAWSNIVSVFVY